MATIEQGQLVRVRNRFYLVQDIHEAALDGNEDSALRVTLECMDDDRLGDTLSLLWENEINPEVFEGIDIPTPPAPGEPWDAPVRLDSFLRAVEWSSASVVEGPALQAPFRAAIEIEDYQLEPVIRASRMPRVCLLIADGVGAGKTIEAAMVAQEMIARGRVRRIMILCPASLQQQWQDEMRQKFNLPFTIINRTETLQLRREYGVHVNPWNVHPRVITSIDFLKREHPLKLFRDSLKQAGGPEPLRQWDLLILDECHNVAPTGRTSYVLASDRTQMMGQILPHFEHRLFLTATPHNGFTESFTALLEMLDPLRFSRSSAVDPNQVKAVMVRRLKEDFTDALGNPRFPKREVQAFPEIELTPNEQELFDLLDQYAASRRKRTATRGEQIGIDFALTILKKRLLSSVYAFHHSLETHQASLGLRGEKASEEAVKAWKRRLREDWDDDEDRTRDEDAALEEAAAFFGQLTDEEQKLLARMIKLAEKASKGVDSKAARLMEWIEAHLQTRGKWNGERIVVFTEYLHTLEYLRRVFIEKGWEDHVMELVGGMPAKDREEIKAAFQAPPDQDPVRILLATDCASEGLNLQNHCRYLAHMEIPWNPNKLEQRNGRIDRKGQTRTPYCYHFVYKGRQDQKFLDVVIDKVRTQRRDLGAIGDVIASQVEEAMLSLRSEIVIDDARLKIAREEVREHIQSANELLRLLDSMERTRDDLHLHPETIRAVLDEALKLEGKKGLEPVEPGHELSGRAWRLSELPPSWKGCAESIHDSKGRLLKLVFDHADQLKNGLPRRDATLVHLNHPLMQRAIGLFRKSVWSQSFVAGKGLRRVTYRVVPDRIHKGLVCILQGRVVGISEANRKLHEAVIPIVAHVKGQSLALADPDLYDRLCRDQVDPWPKISSDTADSLRKLYPAHQKQLKQMLADLEDAEKKRLSALLARRGEDEAKDVREKINERLAEIRATIKKLEKRLPEQDAKQVKMGFMLDEFEKRQVLDDIRFLNDRLARLAQERKTRPDEVRRRYALRTLRIFPLALEYIVSESLLKGGK